MEPKKANKIDPDKEFDSYTWGRVDNFVICNGNAEKKKEMPRL